MKRPIEGEYRLECDATLLIGLRTTMGGDEVTKQLAFLWDVAGRQTRRCFWPEDTYSAVHGLAGSLHY